MERWVFGPTSVPLVIVAGTCLLAGLVLLKLGLWPRRRGTDPHCRKCGYNLIATSGQICPECGSPVRPATVLRGESWRRPGLILIGGLLAIFGGVSLPKLLISKEIVRGPCYFGLDAQLRMLSHLPAIVQADLLAGRTLHQYKDEHGVPVYVDELALIRQRVDSLLAYILNENQDLSQRKAGLVEQKALLRFLDTQVLPKYEAAKASGNPKDAKALAPLMDEVRRYLDRLEQVLGANWSMRKERWQS